MKKIFSILFALLVLLIAGAAVFAPVNTVYAGQSQAGIMAMADSLVSAPDFIIQEIVKTSWGSWILFHIGPFVVVLFFLDKLVKLTPTPYDDLIVGFIQALAKRFRRYRQKQ